MIAKQFRAVVVSWKPCSSLMLQQLSYLASRYLAGFLSHNTSSNWWELYILILHIVYQIWSDLTTTHINPKNNQTIVQTRLQ